MEYIVRMKHHHKLSSQERDKLAYWHAIGISIREIARRLGRSPSTICDELKRNTVEEVGRGGEIKKIYHSIRAEKAAQRRKRNSHSKYLLNTRPHLLDYVCGKLRLGWSPEQIAGRLKKEIGEGIRSKDDYINHESIYQYVYDPAQKDQRLWEYLPRGHGKRRRWLGRKSKRPTRISQRVSIHERGSAIDERREFGHWEGDTIVGDKHKTGIHTEVERASRLLLAYKIYRIKSLDTYLAQLSIFAPLPHQARKSTILDNGSENTLHMRLREMGMRTYFADPYSSWQRGTNEYHNGLVRRYYPKGTDFSLVDQEDLNYIVQTINNTPRKVLDYATPLDVFSTLLLQSVRIDP